MPPFDGAARLIRRAQAAGMSVAVASSGAPAKIHHNLSSAGLLPLLPPHVLVSAAHVAAGKPAPDVYLRAMEVTGGCPPSSVPYVSAVCGTSPPSRSFVQCPSAVTPLRNLKRHRMTPLP